MRIFVRIIMSYRNVWKEVLLHNDIKGSFLTYKRKSLENPAFSRLFSYGPEGNRIPIVFFGCRKYKVFSVRENDGDTTGINTTFREGEIPVHLLIKNNDASTL